MMSMLLLAAMAPAEANQDLLDELTNGRGWREETTTSTPAGDAVVYRKDVQGIPCAKTTLSADVPPNALLEVRTDIPSVMNWSTSDLKASELVWEDTDRVVFYQVLDLPAVTLLRDRYWIFDATTDVAQNGAIHWDFVLATGDRKKEAKKLVKADFPRAVKVEEFFGTWTFEPNGNGSTVTYQACSDFGGNIPNWLQDRVANRTAPNAVADLIVEAESR